MNKKNLVKIGIVALLGVSSLGINLFAQNKQDYKMSGIQAEHYITISREEVDKNNLNLAKVYAQKAIQADTWNKKAWANYNDIIQRLADEGDIKNFKTFIEESTSTSAPSAAGGGSKFEGC